MQWIISGELNDDHLLKYEEIFSKKKATFEKTKVVSFTLLFVFLSIYASLFVFILMTQGLCLELSCCYWCGFFLYSGF